MLNDVWWFTNILIALLTLISVLLMYRQVKLFMLYSKANFRKELVLNFYTTREFREMFYKIEYGEFRYDPGEFHGGSTNEKVLDMMLAYLDVLGSLVRDEVLSIDDIKPLKYEILRIYRNEEVKKYLEFLKSWYSVNSVGRIPFEGFIWISKKFLSEGDD